MASIECQSSAAAQRVLIVDDHPDILEILSMMLEAIGHQTCTAMRGREALHVARRFAPDVILLDLGLPDINGYEVVSALRADRHVERCFIAAITGWNRPQDREHVKRAGFDAHFLKPIELARLREVLRAAASRAAGIGERSTAAHS